MRKPIKKKQVQDLIEVLAEEPKVDLIIKRAREKDKEIVREIKKIGIKILRREERKIKKLVLKEKKMYMLKQETESEDHPVIP